MSRENIGGKEDGWGRVGEGGKGKMTRRKCEKTHRNVRLDGETCQPAYKRSKGSEFVKKTHVENRISDRPLTLRLWGCDQHWKRDVPAGSAVDLA